MSNSLYTCSLSVSKYIISDCNELIICRYYREKIISPILICITSSELGSRGKFFFHIFIFLNICNWKRITSWAFDCTLEFFPKKKIKNQTGSIECLDLCTFCF